VEECVSFLSNPYSASYYTVLIPRSKQHYIVYNIYTITLLAVPPQMKQLKVKTRNMSPITNTEMAEEHRTNHSRHFIWECLVLRI
jgi:hypothetical protein